MNVQISRTQELGAVVPATILGQNVETALTTVNGMLSERLRNPKLVGPPHRMTGIAPEWQGISVGRAAYELTPGAGLMGSEAQVVRATGPCSPALHQNKLQVRAGEELELEIWARAWHEPITLKVELRPLQQCAQIYDSGEIVVSSSFYRRYTLPLKASRTENEARLSISLASAGELWIDQIHLRPKNQPLLCQGIVDEMANMRIPTLRFPGGIVVNVYNWRHGTGPVHLRPTMLEAAFHQDWYLDYDFGLDEYLQICLDQDIMPTITVNVATGTPDDAQELAQYCAAWFRAAGVEPPQIYWHIANHPYHNTTAHMTPEMYIEVLQSFVPRVKAGYPNCRIVGVMSRASLAAAPGESPWKDTLQSQAADLIDLVEVQAYGRCDPYAEPEKQLETLDAILAQFETWMRAFITECRQRQLPWKLGIAEWNWWLQASHWDGRAFEEPPTVLHGLFIAGMIHRFAAMAPDFEVAHFYNLVNCMGILNHRGADVEVTDAVEIFKLYRPALPGRFVPLQVTGADQAGSAAVEALAVSNEQGVWLFVTNHNLAEAVQVSLSGFQSAGAECVTFCGSSPTGTFVRQSPQPAAATSIEVPPLAIVRIKMAQ